MENDYKKEKRIIFSYLAIYIIIMSCIIFAGYQYYRNIEKHFKTNVENKLGIIADLKLGEVEHWLKEQKGDAEIIFKNKAFTKLIKRYFKNPDDRDAKIEIQEWMKEFPIGINYNAVMLTNPQLINKLIIPESFERQKTCISPRNVDSLKAGKLVLEDFSKVNVKQKVFLKVLIPILDAHRLIAIIVLTIDPNTDLYPLLSKQPFPGETSETLLLRRESNEAVYLNELRFKKNSALNVRIALNDTNIVAVRAVLGRKGFMQGLGYRGKSVVAQVIKIPNSPWYLIYQTDESEVYKPLRKDLWQVMIVAIGLFLITGLCFGLLWRNQRVQYYNGRHKLTEALLESEERFRLLYENSTMSTYRTTPDGKILMANKALVKMLRFTSFEDLSARKLESDGFDSSLKRQQFIEQIEKDGEVFDIEAEWKRKDGTSIYIRESARAIRDSNHNTLYYDVTVEDITELKKSELERRVINEIIQGITTTDNLTDWLRLIHQSLGKMIYSENFFVALVDTKTGLFHFPFFIDKFDPTPEPAAMKKSCTAYVFRKGKPFIITPELFQHLEKQNEVELVGSPSPSWMGVPLQTSARTIGVLVLQHYEKEDVYSERDAQFLTTISSQIAIVIERMQAEADLRNERLLLRTVIDNIPDSIYSKDKACRKMISNQFDLHIMGVKSESEILGKTDFDFYPKELAEGFYADDQLVLQTGKPVLNRVELVSDKNGQKQWLLTSKLPLKDDKGNIIGLVGIGKDFTERKHSDDELRESEIKLKVILQSTADGILAIDSNGKIIKTNKRFAELWRIPTNIIDSLDDKIIIRSVLEQLTNPDEFVAKIQKLYNSMVEDLDLLYFKDGRIFELFSAPMVMNDSSIGRVWSFRDISDRKKAEEELKKSKEQLKKFATHLQNNQEEERILLATLLDNELSQMLVALKMDIGMLKKKVLNENINAKSEELFIKLDNAYNIVGNSIKTSMKFMNDLRNEVLYLVGFVEAIMLYSTDFQDRFKINCSVKTDILKLDLDKNQETSLYRIFQNAMSNVAHHSKASEVKINLYRLEEKLILEIIDDGIGFNPKQLTNPASTGLVYMKERAMLLNGEIYVTSSPNKGSCIKVEIPFQIDERLNPK